MSPSRLRIIDDTKGTTLAAASSLDKDVKGKLKTGADKAAAAAVGKLVAERAVKAGIKDVVFDRCSYIYHGPVKAPAEAAAEHGKSVWVLDRPNPIGGVHVERPTVQPGYASFVGACPLALPRKGVKSGGFHEARRRVFFAGRGSGRRRQSCPVELQVVPEPSRSWAPAGRVKPA